MRLTEPLASHLQFTQLDIERQLPVPTECLPGYSISRSLASESIPQGSNINDLLIIDLDDHVVWLHPGRSRRTIWSDTHNQRAVIHRQVLLCCHRWINCRNTHAQRCSSRMGDTSRLDELRHDVLHEIGGYSETHATARRIKLLFYYSPFLNPSQIPPYFNHSPPPC